MLDKLLKAVLDTIDERYKRDSGVDSKVVELIEEIGELEIKLAKALYDAERWGDLSDTSDWRTAEVTRIRRVIESKQRMIETLKRNR